MTYNYPTKGVYSYYNTSGITGTWTAPPGVTLIRVECWGSGGAGGGRTTLGGGGGGGGGAYAMKIITVVPGTTYTFRAAARALGTTSDGADGAASWWEDGSELVAFGGYGAKSDGTPGLGRSAADCRGDVKYSGGNGSPGAGDGNTSYSGAGGSGAGGYGNGNHAEGLIPGYYTRYLGGLGGAGRETLGHGIASSGNFGGGGGGGLRGDSTNRSGGGSGLGLIRITILHTFDHGDGTKENPFQIWDIEDLNGVRSYLCSAYSDEFLNIHFKQMADINLEGKNFWPLGWWYNHNRSTPRIESDAFKSHYDGNNFKILNWTLDKDNFPGFSPNDLTVYFGLFAYCWGGSSDLDAEYREDRQTIKNLILKNTYINMAGYSYGGSIVGYTTSGTLFENCHGTGEVRGDWIVGGLVGLLSGTAPFQGLIGSSEFINSSFVGIVKGSDSVGGFVGQNQAGIIKRCHCIIDMSIIPYTQNPTYTHYEVGGFSGSEYYATLIEECYAEGVIDLTTTDNRFGDVGGFTSIVRNDNCLNCYTRVNIIATGSQIRYGIGGWASEFGYTNLINCYCANQIIGLGNIEGQIGGFVGYGYNPDWVEEDYQIVSCYYDSELSGLSDIIDGARTTSEMKDQSTFIDWDFQQIWGIWPERNDSYPILEPRSVAWSANLARVLFKHKGGAVRVRVKGQESNILLLSTQPLSTTIPLGNPTPTEIWTAEDLNNIRNNLSGNYIQMADIDLGVAPWNEGEGWIPIGYRSHTDPFSGNYDGNGYKILNLTVNRIDRDPIREPGLFGGVTNYDYDAYELGHRPFLKNITIENAYIRDSWSGGYVGLLCGSLHGYYKVLNCNVQGTLESTNTSHGWHVGGMIGYTHLDNDYADAYIEDCHSDIHMINYAGHTGGMFGMYDGPNGYVHRCTARGIIDIGINDSVDLVGGFVGYITGGYVNPRIEPIFEDCHSYVEIINPNNEWLWSGGFAASAWCSFKKCSSHGAVSGHFTGGFIGDIYGTFIEDCYTRSEVTYIGDAENDGECGGFAGCLSVDDHIKNSYSANIVTGSGVYIGGFVGRDFGENNLYINCYYDYEVSGHSDIEKGEPRTTEEMTYPYDEDTTFIEWDFTAIWRIHPDLNDGYPQFEQSLIIEDEIPNPWYSRLARVQFKHKGGAVRVIMKRR
jgi:hypothetical protein